MTDFKQLGISDLVIQSLEKMNFSTPTEIQARAIPHILEGKDILATAQTGTGKTGAFSIPMISLLLQSKKSALILTPTRELAEQVLKVIKNLIGKNKGIKAAFLIGGEPYSTQLKFLRNHPRIIVGTPGRINDHLERKNLDLSKTDFLVIDETDRMLDMGFIVQINEILKHMPEEKQTLMFSATFEPEILKLAQKYLKNPVRIDITPEIKTNPDIKQELKKVNYNEKYDELKKEIESRQGSLLVFVNTKACAESLTQKMNEDGINAKAIHGDLKQAKRERVVRGFRNKKYRIMVATDVVARGLDIPHIEHVINYDMPLTSEDYIHRIGRTGRAGMQGFSISFMTKNDEQRSYEIQKIIDPNFIIPKKRGEKKSFAKKFTFKKSKTKDHGFKKSAKFDKFQQNRKFKKSLNFETAKK